MQLLENRSLFSFLIIVFSLTFSGCGFLFNGEYKSLNNTPIEIEITIKPNSVSNQTSGTITFSLIEGDTSEIVYYCKLNTADYEICTSPFSYSGLSSGDQTFVVRAVGLRTGFSSVKGYTWSVDPREGQFLYSYSYTDGTIQPFALNKSTGSLDATGFSQVTALHLYGLCVSPQSDWLFGAGYDEKYLYGWSVAQTGELTSATNSPWTASQSNQTCAFSTDNNFVYSVTAGPGALDLYDLSSGQPVVHPTQPTVPVSAGISTVVTHPSGQFLYVSDSTLGKIHGYSIDSTTGALTALSGSPFTSLAAAEMIRITSDGKTLLVAAPATGVQSFSVDSATGALTAVTTLGGSLANAKGIAIDKTDAFAIVGDQTGANLYAISIAADSTIAAVASGFPVALTNLVGTALDFDRTGRYVYVGTSTGDIRRFSFDTVTAALTETSDSPVASGMSSVDGLIVVQPEL